MNNIELSKLWKSQDEKLEHLLIINQELLKETIRDKANKALSRAKPAKYLGIILGFPWILFLDALLIIGWLSGGIFFTVSVGAISLFTKIAWVTYIYHLVLIQKVNYADTIVEMQQRIARIKTSSIRVLRLIALQLPFWTTWYLSMEMLKKPELLYWLVNLSITATFVYFSLWLYKNIDLQNMHKPWMSWLFSDTEWKALIKAENVLKQVDEYKSE